MISFVRRLWSYVQPYRARLAMGLICGVIFAFTNVALLGVVQLVINFVFPSGSKDNHPVKTDRFHIFLNHAVEYLRRICRTFPHRTRRLAWRCWFR